MCSLSSGVARVRGVFFLLFKRLHPSTSGACPLFLVWFLERHEKSKQGRRELFSPPTISFLGMLLGRRRRRRRRWRWRRLPGLCGKRLLDRQEGNKGRERKRKEKKRGGQKFSLFSEKERDKEENLFFRLPMPSQQRPLNPLRDGKSLPQDTCYYSIDAIGALQRRQKSFKSWSGEGRENKIAKPFAIVLAPLSPWVSLN